MAGSNSPFSSGSSISSLLRSAQSAQDKIKSFNDAMAAYQWDNSLKTYDDFVAYSNYLQSQAATSADPMDQLTYQKRINTARSGYISNEIQRQSINVIEGAGSNTDKYNKMVNLYYQAADAGQYDLAQSLRLQLDNLSVTIQNEQRASFASGSASTAKYATAIDNQVKDAVQMIEDNATAFGQEFQRLGAAGFQAEYGSDYFSILSRMVQSGDPNNPGLMEIYNQAMGVNPDPTKVKNYQKSFNSLANGGSTGFEVPGVGKVTTKDLQDQAYANSVGQTLFSTIETADGVQFTKNKISGYQYGRDENGNWNLIPIYSPTQDYTANATFNGKPVDSYAGKDGLLAQNNFEVVTNTDGNLTVRNTGQFDKFGIPRGSQIQMYVDANGNLQFVHNNTPYTLNFDEKTGKYLNATQETPNPIMSLVGNGATSGFNNRFLSQQDLTNLPGGSIGLIDTTSPFARFMEAGPLGLVHAAVQKQGQIQLQQAAQLQQQNIAPLQAPTSGNSILSAPASAKITIAQPKPLPKITMPKPKPLPNINISGGTQPAPKITLATGGYSGPGISF